MILYNNKYRGPFEYDKFALNILSFHNMVNDLDSFEVEGMNENITTAISMKNDLDELFKMFTGKDGICERVFLLLIKEKECMK